jgi:cytochrome c
MGFEINKLIAAILVTVLIVFGIGKISDIIFKVNETGVVAYKIEEPARSSNKTKTEGQIDISAFLALGNVEEGKKIFKKCVACHSINKEGRSKIGPALWGVTSRNSGEVDGYKYSKALKSYGKQWNFEELNGFLLKPAKWIKGNKMGFAGLKKDKDRASVILYLNENSDNPIPLP